MIYPDIVKINVSDKAKRDVTVAPCVKGTASLLFNNVIVTLRK